MAAQPITFDFLRGGDISSSRLQDNVQKSVSQIGAIAKGQLVEGVSVPFPSALPASIQVANPLRRVARGVIVVAQNQPFSVQMLGSTSSTLTLSVSLVPKAVNGIITGLSGLLGATTCSLWVF